MPKIVAPKHLSANVQQLEAGVPGWIAKAVAFANKANKGTLGLDQLFDNAKHGKMTSLVEEWFGALDDTQLTTLRSNLNTMKSVINNPNTSIRIVDAPMIVGDRAYYAQVRGTYNAMRPVLSVEVADQWPAANLDTKVNTLFHELSHRILQTLDLGPKQGYAAIMYGISNAQSLANNNPDDALRNAENYGYFIALANGFVNQAP